MRLVSFAADAGRPIRDDGFPAIDVAAFLAHVDNTPRAAAQARNDESASKAAIHTEGHDWGSSRTLKLVRNAPHSCETAPFRIDRCPCSPPCLPVARSARGVELFHQVHTYAIGETIIASE